MLPLGIDGIKLEDYVSGGYYLARRCQPPRERPVLAHLPAGYFSLSGCLCYFFPDCWVWDNAGPMDAQGNFLEGIRGFEGRLKQADRFGITAERLPEVVRWGQLRCGRDFEVPRGCYRLAEARRAAEWVTVPAEELVLFGIGLHRSLAEKFLQDTQQDPYCTVPECVRSGEGLSDGGVALGHELLNTEHGHPCHSWVCNGLERDEATRPREGLNEYGYVSRFESALACARAIERPGVGAEPGPWFPWLIVRYD